LALGAGALLVGALPSQIAHAGGGTARYVSTTGHDSGTCAPKADACATISYAVSLANDGDIIHVARGIYAQQAEITKSVRLVGAGEFNPTAVTGTEIVAPDQLAYNSQASGAGTVTAFTSDTSTTFTATGASDTDATWTADQFDGDAVTDGASSGVVASNDNAGDLTLAGAGWSGGTPASGSIFTITFHAETYVIDVDNSGGEVPTVGISKLSVAGSASGGSDCNAADSTVLASGIDVWGGATLNLTNVGISNINVTPANNCGVGDAVSIGSGCLTCSADSATATLTRVTVSGFQQAGVAVRGLNSTLTIKATTPPTKVTNNANPNVATNGIEIDNSAFAKITDATVSGNECGAVACGAPSTSDLFDSGSTTPFTSDTSTTFSATGASDSTATTWTANQYGGDGVTDGSSSGVIASNDNAGNLTLTSAGWSGGTPAAGSVFSIVTPSYTSNTATDTGAIWTVNQFVGDTVTSGGITDVVKSNTATVLTMNHGWSGGVTPAQGAPFSITTVVTPAAGLGIDVNKAAGSIKLTDNTVTGNDVGIFDNTGEIIDGNSLGDNNDVGLEVAKTAQYGTYDNDSAVPLGTEQYGFYVLSPTLNVFETDAANGNATDDMFLYLVAPDTNEYLTNSCTTAVPSPAYWACS
jgi:hypothetical protein